MAFKGNTGGILPEEPKCGIKSVVNGLEEKGRAARQTGRCSDPG